MQRKPHITSRRGFIAAMGFGAVSLYGLWAGYGAAPGPLDLLGGGGGHDAAGAGGHGAAVVRDGHGAAEAPASEAPASAEGGGHGGHGAVAAGEAAAEFEWMVENFTARYQLPDGSVHPRRLPTDHGAMDHGSMGHGAMPLDDGSPLDVYVLARRFSFEPGMLRLDAGVPYRFRMMAADATHGASIHLGDASRIIRLRPGRPTEQILTFHQPGSYLVYCTVYCGAGHDGMQGRIVVA